MVEHARTLLAVMTALGTFGASLSFSTLNSDTASSSRTLLAWSFAAFITGSAETLVFQVALVADFGPRTAHRVYRSEAGILTGMGVGFAAVLAGTLCLTLSMTASPVAGVRAAGGAVSILLALMVAGSLLRLAYTAGRRLTHSSSIHEPPSIAMQAPHPASVAAVDEAPVQCGWDSERHSALGVSCQGASPARDTVSVTRDTLLLDRQGGCAIGEGVARGTICSAALNSADQKEGPHSAASSRGSPTENSFEGTHPASSSVGCIGTVITETAPTPNGSGAEM